MTQRRIFFALLAVCMGIGGQLLGQAQLTVADYDRALTLQKRYDSLVLNLPEPPVWQESSDSFVYRKTVEGGHEFFLVDAAAQTKQPAFDHEKLAAAVPALSVCDRSKRDRLHRERRALALRSPCVDLRQPRRAASWRR
jgi:hypothetical protein